LILKPSKIQLFLCGASTDLKRLLRPQVSEMMAEPFKGYDQGVVVFAYLLDGRPISPAFHSSQARRAGSSGAAINACRWQHLPALAISGPELSDHADAPDCGMRRLLHDRRVDISNRLVEGEVYSSVGRAVEHKCRDYSDRYVAITQSTCALLR